MDRLVPWLNRELHILISNRPAHIPYILRTIMDALTRHDIRSSQFQNTLRPYFGVHTEHFIHELFNFAGTNYDLAAYDEAVTYLFEGSQSFIQCNYFNNLQKVRMYIYCDRYVERIQFTSCFTCI